MFYVYCHIRNSDGVVVYFGCGNKRRPYDSRVRDRTPEHRALMLAGEITVKILATFQEKSEALRYEDSLIANGKHLPLFNKGTAKELASMRGTKGGTSTAAKGLGFKQRDLAVAAARKTQELGVGVHGRSPEEMRAHGAKAGRVCFEKKVGVHARSKEQMTLDGRLGIAVVNAKRVVCSSCGLVTNPGNLARHKSRSNGKCQ